MYGIEHTSLFFPSIKNKGQRFWSLIVDAMRKRFAATNPHLHRVLNASM